MPMSELEIQRRARHVEGKGAWKQDEAERNRINENMLRLRAERLALEAEPKVIFMKPVKKTKSKA